MKNTHCILMLNNCYDIKRN